VGDVFGKYPIESDIEINDNQIIVLQRKNMLSTKVSFGVSCSHLNFLFLLR
jgi:hypothetical protein